MTNEAEKSQTTLLDSAEGQTETAAKPVEKEEPSFPSGEPRSIETLDGFRFVPDAYFPQTRDYLFTIDGRRSYANTACVRFFPEAEYIQYLINTETRMFALKPCEPTEHHSFRWVREKAGKRTPRQRTGKEFALLISSVMGWDPDGRYQFRGVPEPVQCNGKEEMVLSFDLEYNRPYVKQVSEDGKTRTVPADSSWLKNLGPLYTEYTRSLRINNINGYNVISSEKKDGTEVTEEVMNDGVCHEAG